MVWFKRQRRKFIQTTAFLSPIPSASGSFWMLANAKFPRSSMTAKQRTILLSATALWDCFFWFSTNFEKPVPKLQEKNVILKSPPCALRRTPPSFRRIPGSTWRGGCGFRKAPLVSFPTPTSSGKSRSAPGSMKIVPDKGSWMLIVAFSDR